MDVEVTKLFTNIYGIGVTGYAGKMPGQDQLHAFVFIAQRGKIMFTKRLSSVKEKPHDVQIY
jgi:hypothetical protein